MLRVLVTRAVSFRQRKVKYTGCGVMFSFWVVVVWYVGYVNVGLPRRYCFCREFVGVGLS